MTRIVVVGGSLAGLRACETLRTEGFAGEVVMVGEEPHWPYDRPPLSKQYLSGEWDAERITLRTSDAFASLGLVTRLGERAVALDTATRSVRLQSGEALTFDGLIVATGSAPRRLPDQPDHPNVRTLRTLDDATALRSRLTVGTRLVVIGAGFIGLEVAATARSLGCDVVVLEGLPAPLMRGLGAEMGAAVAAVHGRHGVDVRCGVRVERIDVERGSISVVTDGGTLPADVCLVGVGVAPAVGWLEGSGLSLDNGVRCDEMLNVGVPGIYAAGDCASWPNAAFAGDDDVVMRVEHWTNAAEQGAAAAINLLAELDGSDRVPFTSVPFVWSDQFDSRIQFVGRAHGGDQLHVFKGDPAAGTCAVLYGWQGRLRGVLGVNSPRLTMPFRSLLLARASWDEALTKVESLLA